MAYHNKDADRLQHPGLRVLDTVSQAHLHVVTLALLNEGAVSSASVTTCRGTGSLKRTA